MINGFCSPNTTTSGSTRTQQERAVISNTMTNVGVKEHSKTEKVVNYVKSKFQSMDERYINDADVYMS